MQNRLSSPLRAALVRWRCGEDAFAVLIGEGEPQPLMQVDEVRALALALRHLRRPGTALDDLVPLAGLLMRVGSAEALEASQTEALPELLALVEERGPEIGESTVLWCFKLYVACQHLPGIQQIIDHLRCGRFTESCLWSDVFDDLVGNEPLAQVVCESLHGRPPPGFSALAFLDLANTLARSLRLERHPFDTPAGHARLRDWLTDAAAPWNGRSAAAALPFIAGVDQVELLMMALAHPHPAVRLEALWAAARLGDGVAMDDLLAAAADPLRAGAAIAYLQELDAVHRLPPTVYDPVFQAQVTLVEWLSAPSEFGEPPVEIHLVCERRLFWPPAGAERTLRVLRFAYESEAGREEFVGVVGGMTAALIGETDPGMAVEDILGLHCCAELQRHGDPRAPVERSAATGRLLISLDNPGF